MYLDVKNLNLFYDRAMVLDELSFHVNKGETVSIVGPNGAGKTSALRAIAGLVKWEQDILKGTVMGKITLTGSVLFKGEELLKLPAYKIAERKLILCPERGRPFRERTVLENLQAGAYMVKSKKVMQELLNAAYEIFPILKTRKNQVAGTLSGGERCMLAMARALQSQPELLLLDEPTVGLAPLVKEDLFACVKKIHAMGVTILLTEQDVSFAFELSERNYVLSRGKVVAEGTASQLISDDLVRKTYLGL
ncbi:MAG TPA: branched-chain amino acid ABC transporter ATP-binding protein [Deltaproteobacteria bacterium]|nr:branched-chain amino acid ABC transporter ATP-binding protein [Deltaproteobacteria bacterium]